MIIKQGALAFLGDANSLWKREAISKISTGFHEDISAGSSLPAALPPFPLLTVAQAFLCWLLLLQSSGLWNWRRKKFPEVDTNDKNPCLLHISCTIVTTASLQHYTEDLEIFNISYRLCITFQWPREEKKVSF